MKKYLFAFLFAFFFITLVSAQPPAVFGPENTGYELAVIEPPASIAQNTTYHIHVHVLNKSNSHLVNTSLTCFYHLENPMGMKIAEGFLALTTNSVTANVSYSAIVAGNNFSINGLYNTIVECFDPGMRAGITRVIIEVSYGGREASSALSLWYLGALFYLLFLIVLLIYAYFKLPDTNPRDEYDELIGISYLKYLKLPIAGIVWWLFIAVNFIISTAARFYLSDTLITNFFFSLFTIMMKLSIPMMIVIFVYLLVQIFRDREFYQLMKRGLPNR